MITPSLEGLIFKRLDHRGRVVRHRRMVILAVYPVPDDDRLWCTGVSLPESDTRGCMRPFTMLVETLHDPTRVEQTGESMLLDTQEKENV